MRRKIFDFADCLDLVFMNPLKFVGEWDTSNLNWALNSRVIVFFASLSLAVGSSYISPPYTRGFMVGILLSTFANILILSILPLILGSVLDNRAQKKSRKGSSPMMVDFVSVAMATLVFYAPVCVLLRSLGITGLGGSFFALILVFLAFAFSISRGMKYIYDIKDSDSIRYSLLVLGLSFIYPILFNFYMTGYILNFTL